MSSWVYVLEGVATKKPLSQKDARQRLMLILGSSEGILAAHRGAAPTGEGDAFYFKLSDRAEEMFAARAYGRTEWRIMDRIPAWDRAPPQAASGLRRFLPW
jgi:hypothetical protein